LIEELENPLFLVVYLGPLVFVFALAVRTKVVFLVFWCELVEVAHRKGDLEG